MRLKTKIESKEVRGLFRWYPLVDDDGHCLWPGKFDNEEKIEDLRRSVANELAWQQEYLLRIVSDSTRVVFPEWIQYYDAIPKPIKDSNPLIATGVDLAVKDKETSDYTAMVTAEIHGYGKDMRIYILPNPINAHLTFPDILATIKKLHENFKLRTQYQKIYVEDVQAQNYVVQSLERDRVPVKGINPGGYDKRMRIAFTSEAIRSGVVLFPREGAEILISQLVGFGVEHHDDLADAFAMMINETIMTRPPRSPIGISGGGKMLTAGWMKKKF